LSDTAADLRRRRRLKRELRRTVKIALAKVAEIAIPMTICHFPPDTSRFAKMEHRGGTHLDELARPPLAGPQGCAVATVTWHEPS
jgi:hypothetical protein